MLVTFILKFFKFHIFLRDLLYLYSYVVLIESRLEGWLSLPVRNNTKKFGWVKKVIDTFKSILDFESIP